MVGFYFILWDELVVRSLQCFPGAGLEPVCHVMFGVRDKPLRPPGARWGPQQTCLYSICTMAVSAMYTVRG